MVISKLYHPVSYTHLDVYKRQILVMVCVQDQGMGVQRMCHNPSVLLDHALTAWWVNPDTHVICHKCLVPMDKNKHTHTVRTDNGCWVFRLYYKIRYKIRKNLQCILVNTLRSEDGYGISHHSTLCFTSFNCVYIELDGFYKSVHPFIVNIPAFGEHYNFSSAVHLQRPSWTRPVLFFCL